MGFQLGRSLSVLVLAGVALVGCNNTPDKPKFVDRGPGGLPGNGGVTQQGVGQQGLGQQWQGTQQQFPLQQQKQPAPLPPFGGGPSNPSLGGSGYQPNLNPLGGLTPDKSFAPLPGAGTPGGALPIFPSMSSTTPRGSDASPQPYQGPATPPGGTFGSQRPITPSGPDIAPPPNFRPGTP